MAVKRNYRINLRNYGNPPAIMVSQYDENYDLVFEVFDGVVPATGLNVYTVKLIGRQPGEDPALKYEFTGTVSGIANNILSFTIDTTMTGRAGKGTAEIVILDTTNDVKFASFNLPVYVEKAAVPDDAIDADVERAQEIADEVQDIVDTAAAEVKGEAESWAVGQRDGEDVPSTDPTYHNNAKYYSEVAQDIADSIGIDATLSVSGKAADAKKTGDEISSLKEDLKSEIDNNIYNIGSTTWTKGTENADGTINTGNNGALSDIMTGVQVVKLSANCQATLYLYLNGVYQGKINSTGQMDKTAGNWTRFTGSINIIHYLNQFECTEARVNLTPTDSTTITTDNVQNWGDEHTTFYKSRLDPMDETDEALQNEVNKIVTDGFRIVQNITKSKQTITWTSGLCYANGTVVSSNSYVYSSLINVDEGDVVTLLGTDLAEHGLRTVTAYYDGNIVFEHGTDTNTNSYSVPKGVDQIRISASSYASSSNWSPYILHNDSKYSIQDITTINDVFTNASWEIGSIASATGKNYDDNINAIRTKGICKIGNVVLSCASGWTGKLFKYNQDGSYIGTEDWFKFGDKVELADGYYRFILTQTPTASPTTGTEWHNLFINGAVTQSVRNITGEGMPCKVEGAKIDLYVQSFGVKELLSVPWRDGVSVSNQAIEVYNDVLFLFWTDAHVSLIDINTKAVITDYEITSGHGNSCQFSDEFYSALDEFPLIYCFDYDTSVVYVNRVTRTGATLIRQYNLPINGYKVSGGLDAKSKKLVSVHYTANSSTDSANNSCVISVWDLQSVTVDGNSYVPALVSSVNIPFIGTIQDCKYFKGLLYITSGYWATYQIPLAIYAYNLNGECVTKVSDFPEFMVEKSNSEAEGIAFYRSGNKYRLIFALHYVYELIMN